MDIEKYVRGLANDQLGNLEMLVRMEIARRKFGGVEEEVIKHEKMSAKR